MVLLLLLYYYCLYLINIIPFICKQIGITNIKLLHQMYIYIYISLNKRNYNYIFNFNAESILYRKMCCFTKYFNNNFIILNFLYVLLITSLYFNNNLNFFK